jgi:glycosyltransferase involved in cell wall biosynthesis
LKRLLVKLLPQLTAEVRLLIIDNASDVPVLTTISGLLDAYPKASIRVVRNAWNIGGDANILRCFELCETEFIWVLGDDDEPLPDAVETVLMAIRDNPDALFLNFWQGSHSVKRNIISNTVDDFIESIDSFQNVLFMSTGVFCCCKLTPYLQYGYRFIYSMAPHVVLIFFALSEAKGTCVLLDEAIVAWLVSSEGTRWSPLSQLLAVGTLLDIPLSSKSRKNLARLLPRYGTRVFELLIVQSLVYVKESGNTEAAAYLMDQTYARLLSYTSGWVSRARFMFYRHFLLYFPAAGLRLFKYIFKHKAYSGDMFRYRDPFK